MLCIPIKNVPPDLYQRLKQRAADNRRSVNSESIHLIERAVAHRQVDPDAWLTRARRLRDKTAHYVITDAELTPARRAGRP